jgi:hypothetical protein
LNSVINFFSHHKCATLWLHTYLNRVAELNGRSFFRTNFGDALADPASDIVFFGNATYKFVSEHDLSGCHVIRNPLNLIVSAYYSHLETHPFDGGWPPLRRQRNLLKSVGKEEGMFLTLTFLERADIDSRWIGPLLALRQWDYADRRFETLKMEEMVARPEFFLRPILSPLNKNGRVHLPADSEMAFSNFSDGREPGDIDNSSHYRSGSEDSWKGELPSAIVRYIRTRFDDFMERFYPDSVTWIDDHI